MISNNSNQNRHNRLDSKNSDKERSKTPKQNNLHFGLSTR